MIRSRSLPTPMTLIATTLLAALSAVAAATTASPVVSEAWARATPPGLTTGAVYLRMRGGERADRLLDASTARAARVEFHAVTTTDGVARMRRVPAIDVPANADVDLAARGLHVMLLGLDGPLVEGEHFRLTLQFEHGAAQVIDVEIRAATSGGATSHDPE